MDHIRESKNSRYNERIYCGVREQCPLWFHVFEYLVWVLLLGEAIEPIGSFPRESLLERFPILSLFLLPFPFLPDDGNVIS